MRSQRYAAPQHHNHSQTRDRASGNYPRNACPIDGQSGGVTASQPGVERTLHEAPEPYGNGCHWQQGKFSVLAGNHHGEGRGGGGRRRCERGRLLCQEAYVGRVFRLYRLAAVPAKPLRQRQAERSIATPRHATRELAGCESDEPVSLRIGSARPFSKLLALSDQQQTQRSHSSMRGDLSAAMLIPVNDGASLSDISRSFKSSMAWRCPAGNPVIAWRNASGSRYSSPDMFALASQEGSGTSATVSSRATRRALSRVASDMRMRAILPARAGKGARGWPSASLVDEPQHFLQGVVRLARTEALRLRIAPDVGLTHSEKTLQSCPITLPGGIDQNEAIFHPTPPVGRFANLTSRSISKRCRCSIEEPNRQKGSGCGSMSRSQFRENTPDVLPPGSLYVRWSDHHDANTLLRAGEFHWNPSLPTMALRSCCNGSFPRRRRFVELAS